MASVPIQFAKRIIFSDATYYIDGRQYRDDMPAGSVEWIGNEHDHNAHAALAFMCPCGCKTIHCINTSAQGQPGHHPGDWQWDGNAEKPSLTPSIQCTSPCRWHGYLTKGEFVSC